MIKEWRSLLTSGFRQEKMVSIARQPTQDENVGPYVRTEIKKKIDRHNSKMMKKRVMR